MAPSHLGKQQLFRHLHGFYSWPGGPRLPRHGRGGWSLQRDQTLRLQRGLFIIDDKGILRQITVSDLPVGRSVEEVLRLVQAFQYTYTHGRVCPAGWQPGSDTIKPTVKDSKEYFAKQH
ncbi:peroxiredoxin-1-like [Mauremys reevesii]|uniref:peroxiredoxin-1-like n=1 Tax=Mauremys reevesii TaxID=260615 RepID=UPI00193F3036|nr:peroxiredoxin-1-like [Mauremys reevesii]